MATQAEIISSIAALEKALGSGARIVEYSDKKVEYRSIAELKKALDYWKGLKAGRNGIFKHANLITDKGF